MVPVETNIAAKWPPFSAFVAVFLFPNLVQSLKGVCVQIMCTETLQFLLRGHLHFKKNQGRHFVPWQ